MVEAEIRDAQVRDEPGFVEERVGPAERKRKEGNGERAGDKTLERAGRFHGHSL
jgi:hypothetical protein